MNLGVILTVWLLLGFGSAVVAQRQGRNPVGAFLGGLLIPLAVAAIALVVLSVAGVVWFVAS